MSQQAAPRSARARKPRAAIPERKARAFRAYLDVLDTAAWFRHQVEAQLAQHGLNLERFRVLEILRSEGPMTMGALAEKRYCRKQTVSATVRTLAAPGWLQIEPIRMPAAEVDESRLAKNLRGRERLGRPATRVRLMEEGRAFMERVERRHSKLVYALMRSITTGDMDRLSETCRTIREGDPFKLIHELMMEDPEDREC